MRLILMRHAKSDWSQGLADHDRPLNKRGRRSARALGDWLREKGYMPAEALVSDARRTRETYDGLALADCALRLEPRLYEADAGTMLSVLRTATAPVVLMIGHNPGIAAFAAALVSAPPRHPDFARYPTCATTVLDWEGAAWAEARPGAARTIDFAIPRELS